MYRKCVTYLKHYLQPRFTHSLFAFKFKSFELSRQTAISLLTANLTPIDEIDEW